MLGEAFQETDWIGGFQWPERRGMQDGELVGGVVEVSRPVSEVRPQKSREEQRTGEFPAPNIWEDFGAAA